MNRKVLAVVVACALGVTACAGDRQADDTSTTTTDSPASAASTPNQAELAAEAARLQQEQQAEDAALEAEVKKQTTVDNQLGVIIAASCELRFQGDADGPNRYEDLYRKYWRGGSKWSYSLNTAMDGSSGCPLPKLAPNVPLG